MTDQKTMTLGDDPADFTVDQVQTYLESVDDAERTRVLDAERAGKARVGLLGEPEGTAAEGTAAEGTPTQEPEQAPEPEQAEGPSPSNTKGATFAEAAAETVDPEGSAYERGYFGHAPSRDGDHPEDLTLPAVLKRLNGEG